MITSLYDLAQRFVGVKEITGAKNNPLIVWMSQLSNATTVDDETAWCSAFVNAMAWILRLPRSKSNAARSWLKVGVPVPLELAIPGNDVVILKRGTGLQPGPEVTAAPGHVGLFAGMQGENVLVLAGNQSNEVNVSSFPKSRILGVRRLA